MELKIRIMTTTPEMNMNNQPIDIWIKNGPFAYAKVEHDGEKISLCDYFLARGDFDITKDTVKELKQDFIALGLDKLKFTRPSHHTKWCNFFGGEDGIKDALVPKVPCDKVQNKPDVELVISFPRGGDTGSMICDLIRVLHDVKQ